MQTAKCNKFFFALEIECLISALSPQRQDKKQYRKNYLHNYRWPRSLSSVLLRLVMGLTHETIAVNVYVLFLILLNRL